MRKTLLSTLLLCVGIVMSSAQPLLKTHVGHGGTYRQPHGGEFTIPALAWLDWQLKGDKQAATMFEGEDCGLLKRKDWSISKNRLCK